ncbi:uncharacterized protein LOC142501182 isoform X4 [Ascaphus truei]|uniref:uncharacterized protein LOC142501182 isoform X4 n=1 Tax=Ascaphus truei TaxID=8439 RepID=UPI003F5A4274
MLVLLKQFKTVVQAIIWESAEQIHCLKKKTTVIGICHQDRSRTMQSPGAQTKSESDVSSYSVQDSVMEQRPYACKIPVSTDKPEGTTEPSHKKILETRLKQVEKRSHSTTPVLQQATEQKRVVLKFQKSTSPLPTVKHAPFLMPKLAGIPPSVLNVTPGTLSRLKREKTKMVHPSSMERLFCIRKDCV